MSHIVNVRGSTPFPRVQEVIDELRQYVLGWLNYFRLRNTYREIRALAEWGRRSGFNTRNLDAFRALYPDGKTLVVVAQSREGFSRRVGSYEITFCSVSDLIKML